MAVLSTMITRSFNTAWFGQGVFNQTYESQSLLSEQQHEILLILESSGALVYDLRRSTSIKDVLVSFSNFYRSVTNKSVIGSVAEVFTKLAEELGDHLPFWQDSSWIDTLDDFHKNLHRVKGTILGEKLKKVFAHVIAHSFYHKMGLKVDSKMFYLLEEKKIRPTVWEALTFADSVVGLLLFLAKAGRQALLTGSCEAFFIDGGVVSDWVIRCNKVRKEAEFLGNPSAVDMSLPVYLSELEDCIKTGNMLLKAFGNVQKAVISSVLLELELVQKRYQASLACSSIRFCPIGLVIYGDSGIAKTFIAEGLFNHYCSVRGVDKTFAKKHVHNPQDKYLSGYRSDNLGFLVDDAAKYKENRVLGIDQTLSLIIDWINNTTAMTNQAEIENKGKIPFLSEWFGVTTNIADLSVKTYYKNSYAVLRRLPYRIRPIVKPEYRVDPHQPQIDKHKIPQGVQYPDCWTFEVSTVVSDGDEKGLEGSYSPRPTFVFDGYPALLKWLTDVYQKHIDNQLALLKTINNVGPETLCVCKLPKSLCDCVGDRVINREDVIRIGEVDVPLAQNDTSDVAYKFAEASSVKCHIREVLSELDGQEELFVQLYLDAEFKNWQASYVTGISTVSPAEFKEDFDDSLEAFRQMSQKQRLATLQVGELVSDEDSYLSFKPTIGGKRNFFRSQLRWVRDQILSYAALMEWTPGKKAALEVFVYQYAPRYLADGWDDDSIVRAAFDYIARNEDKIVAPHLKEAREMLMADLSVGPTIMDRICRFAAVQIFTYPWLFSTVCYIGTSRFGRWCSRAYTRNLSPQSRVSQLVEAGNAYNNLLMGKNKFVMIVIAVCSATAIGALLTMAFRYFTSEPGAQHEDLKKIGKKPVVREEEKKNVWVVSERNVTACDFSPKKPHNLAQFEPLIAKNCVVIEYTSEAAYGTTRGMIIKEHTLVMNSHAAHDGAKLTLYRGPWKGEGIKEKFEIELDESMIRRIPERDLAIVTSLAIPANFADIRRLLPKDKLEYECGGVYYTPSGVGMKTNPIPLVRRAHLGGFVGARAGVNMQAWYGVPHTNTLSGECGSPLVLNTGYGPVMVGIHCAFNPVKRYAYAAPLFASDFDDKPCVQVGVVKPAVTLCQSDEVHRDKRYTDFHRDGQMISFGRLEGFRPRPKANGRKTALASYFLEEGPKLGLNFTDRMTTPDMSSWEPVQNILKEYMSPTHNIHEPTMVACADAFADYVIANLTQEDLDDIHVVSLDVAVNGFPGVPNVDAQKFGTSAGHGNQGPKRKYVEKEGPFEEWDCHREYTQDILDAIWNIVALAKQGIRSHPIFMAQLKDEMISLKKKLAKKTRGFYMCPLAFLTAMRMYTMGLTRVMVRRRDLFGIAVGLNTHSEEWDDVFRMSQEIPGDNWMAGDFKGFDKILSILIQACAERFITKILVAAGWSEEDILAIRTMIADIITAVVDFFGELIMLLGGEVSGHQLTTFFNCICNILLHMYCFMMLGFMKGKSLEELCQMFFKMVFWRVLGDDVFIKVHPDIPWFNHTTVQAVFSTIGIEYTMADKESESVPYISYRQVTFLKRTFRKHEAFPGQMVAPLELDSIFKMLLYIIPSKEITEGERNVMVFNAALSEAFYHGKEIFSKIDKLIREAPIDEETRQWINVKGLLTWQELVERYINASPKYRVRMGNPGSDSKTSHTTEDSYCHSEGAIAQTEWSVDPWCSTTMGRSPEEAIESGVRLSSKKLSRRKRVEKNSYVEFLHLSKNFHSNPETSVETGEMTSSAVKKVINNVYQKQRDFFKKKKWENRCFAQADEEASVTIQETAAFTGEKEFETLDLGNTSPTETGSIQIDNALQKYMERPVYIDTFTWAEADAVGIKRTILPWRLLAANTSVNRKLQGFGLFRATLKLKFLINASPFYYGAMKAVYTPLTRRTDSVLTASNVQTILAGVSQKPGVWLNVQETSTAEMTIPFFFPYPYMDSSSIVDFGTLGKIEFVIYSALQSANGVTGSACDVTTMAWFEDIELCAPTSLAVAQSEYKANKQLSSVASNVASIASKAAMIPGIAPYAVATAGAAKAVGAVADLFGFTNVPNVEDVSPFKPQAFSLASTQISEPVQKLSLQPKQETALGGSQYGGPGEDELVLSHFCGRESYVGSVNWTTTHIPGDSLATGPVSPTYGVFMGTECLMAPLTYAAQAFQWWRGSIKFRVKVVRSKYHRGRLQLGWDKGAADYSQGAGYGTQNAMLAVLDLDECDDITFTVPYQQARYFLETLVLDANTAINFQYGNGPTGSISQANGLFNIKVMTRLTAPEATSDARLLLFVSAGDDFELAGPRDITGYVDSNTFRTLSWKNTSVAQSDEVQVLPSYHNAQIYKDTFGERILSLREYLHRSSLSKAYTTYASGSGWTGVAQLQTTIPLKHLPRMPGIWNNGNDFITVSSLNQYGNHCWNHPIGWFGACFIGMKGSVNINVNCYNGANVPFESVSIERRSDGRLLSAPNRRLTKSAIFSETFSTNQNVRSINYNSTSGLAGRALTSTRTNAGLSANLPYYSQSGFFYVDHYSSYNNLDTQSGSDSDWWQIQTLRSAATTDPGNDRYDVYYGTGPDFDLIYFINVPPIFNVDFTAD